MSRRPFLDVFSSALPRPPSGAEPLTSPFGYPGRPAGRPGPQPGPSRARSRWGTCLALRHWEVRAGLGRARAQVGPGPGSGRARGPGSASTSGGFDDWPGGAAAGLPEFGTPGSARTVLTRSGHSVAVSAWCWCVCCLDDPARASRSRPGRGVLCLDAVARLAGSLVAPRGFGCAGLRPLFFAPSGALAWVEPGPSASPPAGAAGRD